MIAKVRIAPIEQWCHWYTRWLNDENIAIARTLVGHEIEIITESMMQARCDPNARMWNITEKTHQWLQSRETKPENFGAICEHVLALGD